MNTLTDYESKFSSRWLFQITSYFWENSELKNKIQLPQPLVTVMNP